MKEVTSFEVFGTRHSKSNYDTYIDQKERGEKKFDPENQKYPDLSEEGLQLAHEKASEFFDKLDVKSDKLFFISSNEARAIATADIYRQEAISRGFEVIKPGKTNSKLADKETDGYVRTSRVLSLNPDNYALHSIFVTGLPEEIQRIIAENLPEEMREKWLRARKIINDAPPEVKKKGWGEVFFQYSDEIKKIFPNIKSSEDLEKQFRSIIKLIEWGKNKVAESGMEGNIKVLGFGHENYVASILDKRLGDRDMVNCESIVIDTDNSGEFNIERVG